LIPARGRALIDAETLASRASQTRGFVTLPVEFTQEAMVDIEDLPRVARQLSRALDFGRVLCGQSDPCAREIVIEDLRISYRVELEQVVVLGADPIEHSLH
jgi:hypothetical protein